MESYDKLLAEEIFFIKLQSGGILSPEDIAGKECLVICAMGGVGLWRKIYAQAVEESLMQAGAAKCDHIVLFNSDDLDSLCDLTDVEQAVGTSRYDYIIVLGGMEKTRDICEGVRQLQEVCRPGGKIFVAARTPQELSARHEINAYEDVWRYDADDLPRLFAGCSLEMMTSDAAGEIAAAVFTRSAGRAETSCSSLLHAWSQRRIDPNGALPQGYFRDASGLDAVGIKYRTDKCSMIHNYLRKYEFFLERFHSRPLRLLELGIFKGASLRMWQEYFPQAEIFGVDIEEHCSQYADERIHILQADLSNTDAVSRLKDIRPQIIIDDASHMTSHQILALFTLFDVLPSGGIYILEDLETSLNPEQFEAAYRDAPLDAYEVCARIARIAARKVPDDDSLYADYINQIGMETELVSIMKGSVVLVKR